jgi:CBS domain-containing protein
MKVRDVMSTRLAEISAAASCQDAAQKMRDEDVGILVVTSGGRVIEGTLTDRDLVTRCVAAGADPAQSHVGDYMERNPTVVEGDLDLERAVEIMRRTRHHRLPVTIARNKVIGLLSLDDVALDARQYMDAFLSVAAQYSRRAGDLEGALGE